MTTGRFSGPLAEPIRVEGDPNSASNMLMTLQTWLEKLDLLFGHFGISERGEDGSRNDRALALRLAMEFVPGFKLKLRETRGRPVRGGDVARSIMLIVDVEKLKDERGCSDSEAVRILVTSPRFRARWGGSNKRTLENRLHAVRRSPEVLKMILHLAIEADHHENTASELS